MRLRRLREALLELLYSTTRSRSLSFLYLIILCPVVLTAVYELLGDSYGPWRLILGCLTVGAVIFGIRAFVFLHRASLPGELLKAPREGLIVIVSPGKPGESAALGAIKYHFRGEHDERDSPTLAYLWLIHSRQYDEEPKLPFKSSYEIAKELERTYKPLLKFVRRLEIDDVDDPAEVFQRTQDAYWWATRRLDLNPKALIADITGGTKSMTIGLAYAGIPAARDLQFMKPREIGPDGRAVVEKGADPYLIDVRFVDRSTVLGSP